MSRRADAIRAILDEPLTPEELNDFERLIAMIPTFTPPMRRKLIDILAMNVADEIVAALAAERLAKATAAASPRRKKQQAALVSEPVPTQAVGS